MFRNLSIKSLPNAVQIGLVKKTINCFFIRDQGVESIKQLRIGSPAGARRSFAVSAISIFYEVTGMIVTTVRVYVIKEHIEDFINATIDNHRNSVKESGNLRFDVLQSVNNPSEFTLYEAYESDEAAAAHKETEHYKVWRDKVAPWMAKPREGIPHRVISPADRSSWK